MGERQIGGDHEWEKERERDRGSREIERTIGGERETGIGIEEREKKDKKRDRCSKEISIGKNKEYKKEKIFYMDVLKTIHKKIAIKK